jgi:type IV pilus assembly protein PilQ
MKSRIILILLFLLSSAARGQEIPEPEYTPPESLVSLSSSLDFGIALNMLSEYAIRFAGKPIYDPTKQSGTTNIEVTGMPWEKALQTILARRGLWYEKKEHFFQVVVPPEKEATDGWDPSFGEQVKYKPGSKEVKIETIFFEGDRKALTEMGIDWGTFYNGKIDISGALTSSVTETGFSFGVNIPRKLAQVDINALFKLFDSRNIGRVIAQPQVVVTAGNEGKIQVGQDFSIKSKDFAGNTMDRFISTGTILEVTPFVIENEGKNPVILLKAHVERSQAYPDVVSTIIKKSEANSLVQLYDGEETLIAGLYSNEKTTLRKGVPILKDLPWYVLGLRYAFGYDRYEDTQKELIIIIKASIFPEVYARQAKGASEQARSSLQERLQHYRFDKQVDPGDLDLIDSKKTETSKRDADPKDQPKASETVPAQKVPANSGNFERPNLEIRNGTVQNVKNNLLLINWEKGFDTAALVKQTVTIVRREGDRVKPVGMAEVLRAKSQQTVARRVASKGMADVPLRAGDQAVIRYTAFTSLGATQ